MAKKIISVAEGIQVQAAPWREGKIVAGVLLSVDALPGVDSRKITFEAWKGEFVAVWETATLKRQLTEMKIGGVYQITCLGKNIETKNGMAWGFDVLEAENDQDQRDFEARYREYVVNAGK